MRSLPRAWFADPGRDFFIRDPSFKMMLTSPGT